MTRGVPCIEVPQHVLDRVMDRVDVRGADECWPWKLSIGSHGYGQIGWNVDGKNVTTTAHRAAWSATNGPIAGDLTVDHICRNKVCCNPAHLRLLSNVDNARDNVQAQRGPGLRSYKEVA